MMDIFDNTYTGCLYDNYSAEISPPPFFIDRTLFLINRSEQSSCRRRCLFPTSNMLKCTEVIYIPNNLLVGQLVELVGNGTNRKF